MRKKGYYTEKKHIPVMLNEVTSALNINPNGIYLDGTLGKGGHTSSIIKNLSQDGLMIGIDRDLEAIQFCEELFKDIKIPHSFFHDSYHNINHILNKLNIKEVDGIILDLGLSSVQLSNPKRGFSYNLNADLDMRFDLKQKLKASDIINILNHQELANIIFKYGEEKRSRSIAKSIEKLRPLKTVFDLVEAVRRVTPPNHRKKSLSRVFQAIRIKVNEELKKLDFFLLSFIKRLKLGGRIIIISFHSLEDRLVKHHFKNIAKNSQLRIQTKKPLLASRDEILNNKRSRSAKLRIAEKIINA